MDLRLTEFTCEERVAIRLRCRQYSSNSSVTKRFGVSRNAGREDLLDPSIWTSCVWREDQIGGLDAMVRSGGPKAVGSATRRPLW